MEKYSKDDDLHLRNDIEKEAESGKDIGFFECFVNNSDQWEYFLDEEGSITFSNTLCEQVTGYSREDFYKDKSLLLALIHDPERKVMVRYVINNPEVEDFSEEYRLLNASGELVWVQHTCKAVFDKTGKFLGRRVNCKLINDFKLREQKLINAQNRLKLTHSIFYELVSEQSIENIIRSALYQANLLFPELRISYGNIEESGSLRVLYSQNIDDRCDAEGSVFDLKKLELGEYKLGRQTEPLVSEDSQVDERLRNFLETFRVLEIGSLIAMPLQHTKAVSGVICFDAKHERKWSSHEIKTLSNISDFLSLSLKLTNVLNRQQRAERNYREVSTRMMNLMDTLAGGIIFENENGKIIHVNKSFCNLFSLDNCYKKLPNQDCKLLHAKIAGMFEKGFEFLTFIDDLNMNRKAAFQECFRLVDGRTMEVDYIPVFLGKEYNGRLWHFRDVTERISSQEQLRRNQELLMKKTEDLTKLNEKLSKSETELIKTNAEKDRFFSILAHDLRHPFSPILGFSEMMMEEAESLSTGEVKEYAGVIFNSSTYLLKLVENLLEWSRVQSGRIKIEPVLFNVRDLVFDSVNVYKNNAENKGVTIKCEIPSDLNAVADLYCIDTVIRNLLSNAIKFTDKDGTVKISANIRNNVVSVKIEDTGIGMSEGAIQKLFKLDAQFSTPGTQREKGTGLGLILVKDFIELNNGEIKVESKVGVGTAITFTLPAHLK